MPVPRPSYRVSVLLTRGYDVVIEAPFLIAFQAGGAALVRIRDQSICYWARTCLDPLEHWQTVHLIISLVAHLDHKITCISLYKAAWGV
jgi:hypothetical protein